MPFCPECRTEYVPGAARCADCDVDLIDSLPEPEEQPDSKLVMLAPFPNEAEARLVQELLKNNGIEALLRGGGESLGFAVSAIAPALMVAEPDLARAEEIYEAYFAGDAGDVTPPPEGEFDDSDPDVR